MNGMHDRYGLLRPAVVGAAWFCAAFAALAIAPEPAAEPAPGQARLIVTEGLKDAVHSPLLFSPDGKKIAIGQYHSINIFDTVKGKELACLTWDKPRVYDPAIGFRAGGDEFLTSDGKTITIWDLKTNKVDRTVVPPYKGGIARLTGDGNTLVFPGKKGEELRAVLDPQTGKATAELTKGEDFLIVLDLETGKAITEIKVNRRFDCLAISRDGKWAATGWGNMDPKVVVYDLKAGKELLTIDAYPVPKDSGSATGVRALAFSPDGKSLLTLGQRDNRLIKWEVATGKHQSELHPKSIGGNAAMAWAPDGKTVAVVGSPSEERGARLGLWKPDSVQVFDDEVLGRVAGATQLVFSPDGKTLAVAGFTGDQKSFALWDIPQPGDKKK